MTAHVEIKHTDRCGRFLVAKKDFHEGEIVLKERPLLLPHPASSLSHLERDAISSFQSNTGLETISDFLFLKAFCKAEERIRSAVLDCFTPPLTSTDSTLCAILKVVQLAKTQAWSKAYSSNTLETVILVKATNSHSFEDDSALFSLGSKINHSCCPNLVYTSQRESGFGCFVAIKPIRSGQEVNFSYIDTYQSTPMRRKALRARYLFDCQCSGCTTGFDYYRGFDCPTHPKEHMIFFNQESGVWVEPGNWTGPCQSHDPPLSPLNLEGEWEDRITRVTETVSDPKRVRVELAVAEAKFSRGHAIVKLLEKHLIGLLVDTRPDLKTAREISRLTEGLIEWALGDAGVLGTLLLRVGCYLGRSGDFDGGLKFINAAEEDQKLVLSKESEISKISRRARVACKSHDASRVPELEPRSGGCPIQ